MKDELKEKIKRLDKIYFGYEEPIYIIEKKIELEDEILFQFERIKLALNELEPRDRGYIELLELLLYIEKQLREDDQNA
ncbi:hypothetical protein TREPR_2592 [Treponema primitia ZAS-2]|uniref:Uncharacterized protein n=1 Tax=Treponema primitia (strain ATCC BAA-887 / DSM 12427 / ZAS-2) TaxID=545694 RepID=F5YGJ2_TREPZ|nr:hypothetical protein [Treponema primitia]AEF86557.1 hypothetical protein TREPR_2592 [Treponema primitia ZAS-2]